MLNVGECWRVSAAVRVCPILPTRLYNAVCLPVMRFYGYFCKGM